jgi:hypothetical protein
MPDRAPTRIAPTPTNSPAPLPIPQNSPLQGAVASANAATPRPKSTTEAVARAVSATGAATDVLHSGAGCASGSGPLVKMREHPGLVMRMSVATEMRSIEFATVEAFVRACLRVLGGRAAAAAMASWNAGVTTPNAGKWPTGPLATPQFFKDQTTRHALGD